MRGRKATMLGALAALGIGALSWSFAGAEGKDPWTTGKVELRSANVLEMGPDGVLFVGDSLGSAVWALDLGVGPAPPKPAEPDRGPIAFVQDLDGKIAAMLGTDVRQIRVEDMAVEQSSLQTYVAVTRGRGTEAKPVLLKVAPDGKISEVALDKVRHSRALLPNQPAADAKLWRFESRALTITDLELVDGELYVAGLSNEEFASTLRRVPYPFRGELASAGLEIYHGAHGKYETHAPIFSFIPYQLGGKTQLLAGYLCTPLVTFPLEEARAKDRLRGKTIAELGFGNVPIDIVPYRYEGEEWVLMANTNRGSVKYKRADLEAAQGRPGITADVGPRTGLEDHSVPLGAVVQLDKLGDDFVATLTRDLATGTLDFGARSVRWL